MGFERLCYFNLNIYCIWYLLFCRNCAIWLA